MNLRDPIITILFGASMAVAGCATVPTATQRQTTTQAHTATQPQSSDVADAQSRVRRAGDVINQMNSQPEPAALLRDARAVLIVVDYARVGFILGEQGGGAVLLAQHNGHWRDPAFYDVGGVSIGLQLGVEAGPVAYVLMTPRAMQEFANRKSETTLGADAGLTVIKISSDANMVSSSRDTNFVSSFPTADVVVWTGTAGLFGGVALDSSHVVPDQKLDEAYHHGSVR